MNKVMIMFVTVLLMAACATLTPEEKAAREAAATALNVSLPSSSRIRVSSKCTSIPRSATLSTMKVTSSSRNLNELCLMLRKAMGDEDIGQKIWKSQ